MIVEQVSISNDDQKKYEYSNPVKKVNRLRVENYKSFTEIFEKNLNNNLSIIKKIWILNKEIKL